MVIVTSFSYPESPLRLQQTEVRAVLDKRDLGVGTLYISESTLSWQEEGNKGFSISYPKISMHAISKDVNVYPTECIYIMLDSHITLPENERDVPDERDNQDENDREEFSDAESESDISQLLLIPQNSALVPIIFESIKVCQELNPDPNDIDDDDDDEDNMFADAEDMLEGEIANGDNELNGDAGIHELSERLQNQRVNYSNNGHNDEEGYDQFEDAD